MRQVQHLAVHTPLRRDSVQVRLPPARQEKAVNGTDHADMRDALSARGESRVDPCSGAQAFWFVLIEGRVQSEEGLALQAAGMRSHARGIRRR